MTPSPTVSACSPTASSAAPRRPPDLAPPAESPLHLVGPWTAYGPDLALVHGPAPLSPDPLRRWLADDCRGTPPVRQGFAAALTRPDGSFVIASGRRSECSALYAGLPGRLVVGVHPRDVVRALPRPPALDVAKIADLVALHDDPERTVHAGIRRVPLGHALLGAADGSRRLVEWFRPGLEPDRSIDIREAPALLRDAVTAAVAASLPADGPVAATLSGGLDSTMVVAAARGVLPPGREIHAFAHVPLRGTADPGGLWEADDGPYVRAFVEAVDGVRLTELRNDDLVPPLVACARALDRTWLPTFNPVNQHWVDEAVAGAEAAGSRVLLTGAAGNATFSRSRQGILRDLGRDRRLLALLREVRRRRTAGEAWAPAGRGVLREALPADLVAAVAARRRRNRTGPVDVFAAGPSFEDLPYRPDAISDAARAALEVRIAAAEARRADWIAFALADTSRTGPLLRLSERVWWSDPLSDHELLALALRLPEEAWLTGGRDRGLARQAGAGLVPDVVRLRRTFGAQGADIAAIVRGQEQAYRDLLDRFRDSPVVPQVLDVERMARWVGPSLADPRTAAVWQGVLGRALAVGQFVVWYEDRVLSG